MKELSKDQIKRRDELIDRLADAKKDIDEDFEKVRAAIEILNEARARYNAVLEDARELRDEIVDQIDEYIDGKSDDWQSSTRGQAYVEWKDTWENEDLEDLEDAEIPDLTFDPDHDEILSAIPVEVES